MVGHATGKADGEWLSWQGSSEPLLAVPNPFGDQANSRRDGGNYPVRQDTNVRRHNVFTPPGGIASDRLLAMRVGGVIE
jgi:hypothetical protein